jgi:dTDP-4-amino-4,6-dideoxygalactose transaminase
MQPIYGACAFLTSKECGQDVGADIFQRGLCLPSDINMTAEEQDKVIQIIRSCFE